ncbi:N-acetylglucosamine-6-phosphate deacetylase [Staphylococcus sp. SQ8-PEA]|uniref:N-acetylglucosamine-6-phosphate deacetylase n=1 Tax=Staphylococcus marylandisciuri TaxID=2981529 RepID=A0ABT2QP98_9STAP|nr:N-acetylglucosamine-6-phosphate deacetylase [Staphylococcus marylandisciuri]MCU5745793.1 N-acetylglucosamine-6-phosphate deacetylase [Staphylococcus marylandisciuri]
MMEYVITNGRLYTEEHVLPKGYIKVKNGQITAIEEGDYEGQLETIDAQGHHIIPGFIDIHIHGGYGEDVMDASEEGLKHLAKNLLSEGTTSFLATTMTQSDENVEQALRTIARYKDKQNRTEGAEILGIHLEGPFISEHKVGAQNPAFVQRPSVKKVQHFQDVANQLIKIITFAPEVEGALETVEALHEEIIFSMGHTAATFEEANQAVEYGAQHITHLYNAATSFEHRNPGVFGAAWTNERLATEIIVDGVHSHPAAVAIAYKQKGNQRFYLITDAMRAKGMPEGAYDLGGQTVHVKGSEARLATGSLAGSILRMNEGLENLKQYTGASLEELWRVTSLNQAQALGVSDQKGSLKVGKDADLVILDHSSQVMTTIKGGKPYRFD